MAEEAQLSLVFYTLTPPSLTFKALRVVVTNDVTSGFRSHQRKMNDFAS
jgi:hypothetical protein